MEEFKHFTPEVSRKRLRTLASKMDKDSDERIDKKELQVQTNL